MVDPQPPRTDKARLPWTSACSKMSLSLIVETDFHGIGGKRPSAVEDQEKNGWQARSDTPPWHAADPFDWSADPFKDPNWYAIFHSWRPMDAYLRAYWRTKNGDALQRIIPWMASWGDYHATQNENADRLKALGGTSGSRAVRLSIVLDAVRSGALRLDDQMLDALMERGRADAAWLMTPGNIHEMNHGYYQIMGLELISRVMDGEPWVAEARAIAASSIASLIGKQFTSEGVHVENSPCYHEYSLQHLLRSSLHRVFPPETHDIVARSFKVLPWLVFPDGNYADIGDCTGRGPRFKDAGVDPITIAGEPYVVAPFWASGYAIVRSPPEMDEKKASMLLLVGTAHSHTHSHADKLSFELYELGRRLIIDTGKYGYVRPMDDMRRYVESAAAHNTVGLADEPINRTHVTLGGTELYQPEIESDAIKLSGSVRWNTRGFDFDHFRQLTYRPARSLEIKDTVVSQKRRAFATRLHFSPDLTFSFDGNRMVADAGDGKRVIVEIREPDVLVSMYRGDMAPIRGWRSTGYLKMEPTTMVEAVWIEQTRTITWLVSFE